MESLLLVILWAVLSEAYSLSSLKEVMGRKGGSVWIPCYYDIKYSNSVKFFFYKGAFGRHIILAETEPILRTGAGERIIISDDKSQGMFTITMRRLKKNDQRGYYCGLKRETQTEHSYLYLSVDEGDYGLSINSNINVFTGQEKGSVAVSCKYTYPKYVSFKKYWCRGRDFDSCQKWKVSDSPRNYNNRVSIRDDIAGQEFTVTMTSLQMTDSDWYWCAIQKAYSHERVPVYIRVTPVTSVMTTSRNQRVKNITLSENSTEHRSAAPGTDSVSEERRAHLTIVLVIGGLLLLFLTAGIVTLRMKRNRKGETQNEKRTMQAEGQGRTEMKPDVTYATVSLQTKTIKNKQADEEVQYANVSFRKNTKRNLNVTEPPSEDMQYAVVSFQRKTTEETKPSRDPEDSVTYSVIGIKGTADTYIFEN
ncbi:hypothetical protein SKAU_G00056020 [Synaphobranchus kaupii]|uniref:Polymeric immunoglobulin receptor-like n=1 Tax=Synaphobranchus kaupii TaxID=118154 RepID=A0A9Q1G3Y7_SYNKA|nr:hypothetical protein SKAU_G00056020 [Synaphobranchus kaupii]